ncbi:MAG: ferritin [Flavobacteriales bacterium]|nr:ferritin [Flavobacteriales bacterium]
MIDPKVEKVLIEQMAKESASSALYLSMHSWLEMKGLEGCATFMFAQAEEERTHMLKLMKYINDSGGHAIIQGVKQPKAQFKNVKEIFELVLESEKDISRSIHQLVDVCTKLKDYTTLHFLQWYVAEQHEEEKLARTILDKLEIIGLEGNGLYLFDKEIAGIQVQTEMKAQDAGGAGA